MIGRVKDPELPHRDVHVPLRWNDERGRWEVTGSFPGRIPRYVRSIDAAANCWRRFRDTYRELVQAARLLRVMCEHPDFEFEGDAVSADMVRERVRALSRTMSLEQEDVERMLDEPRSDDVVWLLDERYVYDPRSTRLEPAGGETELMVPLPPVGARARFEWLVHICALFAEELTGHEHAPAEVAEAVGRVQERLRDEGLDNKAPH